MVPIETQVEALVRRKAYQLAREHPSTIDIAEAYREVFTASKTEILRHLQSNWLMRDLVISRPGDRDGLYAVPHSGSFEVYYQERGIKMLEKQGLTEEEVWRAYVDYITGFSGTGFKFEW